MSQRPFSASGWKRRCEQIGMAASAAGKRQRFTKLDLTAIIVEQQLKSKNTLLEYAQTRGSEAMQHFVSNRQKHLVDYLQEAWEWNDACAEAARDRRSGWELVCEWAEKVCQHGDECRYAQAAQRIFMANSSTLNQQHLAANLRNVILTGPSKTTRVPLLVGSTNTGKTTLVLPFDHVFGQQKVFHKPALGSKFGLRNILRQKRFIFWDDYRPVEYAQATVQVSTFLSLFTGQPFEVQVSQSFSDGNIDFQWRHGCVMTAKAEGLWVPMGCVSEEDIRHMKSRVNMFEINAQVDRLQDIEPCPVCMCRWILSGAVQHDAAQVLQSPRHLALPQTQPSGDGADALLPGLEDLNSVAQLSWACLQALSTELLVLGARHAREVMTQDWEALTAFHALKPFEKRRLLAAVHQVSS
eukprot:Skav219200  [mRNA]  locus=scaffold537:1570:2802:- [translate_table: standard]